MNNYFKLPTEDKRMVLQQTAANYGLPPQAIEKDIWVTTILQIVFSLPIAESLIFKGETVLKVKVPPVRIENSLSPLYRGTDFSTLAETFKTVWGRLS